MIYVMSDIHGRYDLYSKMLRKIDFSHDDTLYILGDIVDRGPESVKILLDVMDKYNIICLAGNHELMMLDVMKGLLSKVNRELTENDVTRVLEWYENGGNTTINEIENYDIPTRRRIIKFILDMDMFEEITVNGRDYILVHAGLGNFSLDKDLYEYEYDELVWSRADYSKRYFSDKYLVTGHTPTQCIEINDRKGYIFRKNNHIAIDCGAGSQQGRLSCLCLDTDEEFYLECTE